MDSGVLGCNATFDPPQSLDVARIGAVSYSVQSFLIMPLDTKDRNDATGTIIRTAAT